MICARSCVWIYMRTAWFLTVLTGCLHVHVPPQGAPRGGSGLNPGDRVVARSRGELREATVITVDGALVTLAWDAGSPDRSQLTRSWIVRVDERGRGTVKAGDWRWCPSEEAWVPCRAEPAGDGLALQYADGTKRTIAARDTLPIPAGLTHWTRARGEKLLDVALDVGPPPQEIDLDTLRPRAAGQPVAIGDRVLAHWSGGGWWEAKVDRISPSEVVVSWADGSAATPVSVTEVAPMTNDLLGGGDVGLCRWTDTQWWPARITNRASGRLHIIYSDGTALDVPTQECVAATATPQRG
jgi:hypothetical protein